MFRAVAALLFLAPLFAAEPAALDGLDAAVEAAMRKSGTPGLALGVWQNGRVVYAKGFGFRDVAAKLPVTTKTLFGMGSVSKSFTASVAATVVDEGKLSWDRPVREYVPWFRMYDPVATELATIRDMLSHRTGMPGHNFIRFSTFMTREELVRRVRYLEHNKTFRETYQYNNLMYTTAGYVAGVAAGSTWEDLVRDRIYTPLGMTRSNTSTLDSQKSDDFARPYRARGERDPEPIEFYVYQQFGVGPNGAVNSCVDDMFKYLEMYLNGGTYNGRQIISRDQMAEILKPVSIPGPTVTYALGWQRDSLGAHARIHHGGAIDGFRAHAGFLPDHNIAVVAMINSEDGPMVDRLFDEVCARMVGVTLPERKRAPAPQSGSKTESGPKAKPSKPLADYIGTYFHPAYGEVTVEPNGDKLNVRFSAFRIGLTHRSFDTFVFGYNNGLAQFRLNNQGEVAELLLPLEPAVQPLVFVKR